MTATRRLAAILAADIAGYSRLMGADEEGTLAAVKAIRREVWDARVEEHRGRIVKTTGDGLLVEFQSVVDAVRCAVELQRAIAERNVELAAEKRIEFRIGINLGDVILDEGDIYGDGVNLAARLEALAEPGEICVSRVVREQVRDKLDIVFDDIGERRVKNIARPVHVYRVPIAGPAPAPPHEGGVDFAIGPPEVAVAAPADMFVGRERELAVLRGAFDEACTGRGRIVMLAGEPGIGKTRTAQELAVHAAARDAVVLWGRCNEEAGAPPYWPWVQVIRAALRGGDLAVLAELGAGAGDLTDIVPEIRELLPGLEASAPLADPSEARFRMFESIRQLLAGLGRRRPLLIVLDDLHWADAPSLRLLEFLAPELGGSRLLLVGTYRATELSRRHPLSDALGALARAPRFARVNLVGLSAEEVQALVVAAGTPAPAGLAKSLHQQTEGNPLFLREIVRFLEQRGARGLETSAADAALPAAIRIPEGVTEVIGRRLNLLSAGCNEVLALASVIGRDFAWEVLLRAAAPLSEDMLLEALDEAVAAHIAEETAPRRYRFTHNLIRVTLYDELRIARRRQLHRAVGNAIEALCRADLDLFLPELARHFQAAGHDADAEKAIDYATRAGRRADALLAFEDAVQFFRTSLDLMEQRAEPDEAARCRLLFLLGEARRKSNDFSGALTTLCETAKAASGLGLADVLAHAALAYEQTAWRSRLSADPPPGRLLEDALREVSPTDTTLRARLVGALARALLYAGAEPEARAQAAEAIAMAGRVGDPAVLAANISHLFNSFWGPESTEELLHRATEMVAAARRSGDMELVAQAHAYRLPLYLELGDITAVEAEINALTRIDARVRQRTYSVSMLGYRIMLALMRGEFADAERLIVEFQALLRGLTVHAEQLSMQIFMLRREQGRLTGLQPVVSAFLRRHAAASVWRPGLALMYLEVGQLEEARTEYEKLAADNFAAVPRDGRWLYCMVYLSDVCATLGDAARAATLYRLMSPYAGRNIVLGGGIACCGSADRYLGLLCTTMAHWSDAQQHFERALAMNNQIGARVALAHTRYDHASMLLARDEATVPAPRPCYRRACRVRARSVCALWKRAYRSGSM